ncbi:MAG: glycerate 2-kinase [Colwellia sp.]|jgi:glycerate 2-kinase|tara:strand:- start:1845 stop:3113 length:1269 start_codon:yes stop_codon:yes gene_type:complete
MNSSKTFLQDMFHIAVNESLPSVCMPKYLSDIDASNGLCVIGAGKASVDMAKTIYEYFGEKCYGTVVTRHGYTTEKNIGTIKILTAGHPIPDSDSQAAGKEILALAQNTPKDIPVVFLISGGGSALLSLPIDEVTFAEKMQLNKFLLGCGASINEINGVRQQLSKVKGGKLRQAIKGDSYTLIISDVVGDDPKIIASGPTVENSATGEQALSTLVKYGWQPIPSVEKALQQNEANKVSNIDTSDHKHKLTIMANARQSIDKVIDSIDQSSWKINVINYDEVGDANEVARQHAALALAAYESGQKTLLFSGGELTVTLAENAGQGGPNQQYMLALAIALNGAKNICALACDTDGIDGSDDIAGAYIDEFTLVRAHKKGLQPELFLMKNDCYNFFKPLNDLIITGPTHTNVNDFRVIMIAPCLG